MDGWGRDIRYSVKGGSEGRLLVYNENIGATSIRSGKVELPIDADDAVATHLYDH